MNRGEGEEADLIKRISPVAWRHINLYGRYEFHRNNVSIDIEEIVNSLEDKLTCSQLHDKKEEYLN